MGLGVALIDYGDVVYETTVSQNQMVQLLDKGELSMFFDHNRAGSQSQSNPGHPHTKAADANAATDSISELGNIFRMAKALAKTGMKRTSFLNLQDPKSPYFDPTFPKRIRLGARSVGWAENELEAWLLNRKSECKGGGV